MLIAFLLINQILSDFILKNYSLLTRLLEAIPVIVGFMFFNKYKSTRVIYFIYFLLFVLLGEIIARYPGYLNTETFKWLKSLVFGTVFQRNYWWYTIFWVIGSSVFYAFYFHNSIKVKLFRGLIKWITISFVIASIFYLSFYWDNLRNSSSYFINVYSLINLLVIIVLFFLDILTSSVHIKLYKQIDFHIAFILLIWWLIITPLMFFNDYFNALDEQYTNLQWFIRFFANVFMYIGFSLVLIFGKPENAIND